MVTSLERIIYWLMCGLAGLTVILGIILAVGEWPSRAPPDMAAVHSATILTTSTPDRLKYTFVFTDGARYLVEGPAGQPDLAGARENLKKNLASENERYESRREAALLPLGACVAIALALYLLARAILYVLGNK